MVITVNGVRYACASCIRGHRVKNCVHQDRELIALSKRGRRLTQCNHCRDLRKTNNSHIKCTCATSNSPNPINGCLCELVLTCTCVAHHLQEIQHEE
ncbi:copper fist DNA binding domain-containing protein [Blakeslea trispora]|nr:copper fist DNA binding domain-containing protein [Blakeslea trispora]